MKRFLKSLGITNDAYSQWSGQSVKDFAKANPEWSGRAWEVLIVENKEVLREGV